MRESRFGAVAAWNIVFGLSTVAALVGLVVLFSGRQSASRAVPSNYGSVFNVQESTRAAQKTAEETTSAVQRREWRESAETLGSSVLASLSTMAEKRHVEVASFRTEKVVEVAHLRETPFVAVVEGGYPDVAKLVEDLEDPKVRLALNTIEVTGSESESGQVRTTLSLIAFAPGEGS